MKFKFIVGLLLTVTLAFQSCVKSDNVTVALPLQEQKGDIPYAVIPVEIRKDFMSKMNLYNGTNPPNIIGEYVMSPMVARYCSDGEYSKGYEVTPTYFAFVKSGGKTIYFEKEGVSEGSSNNVSVVGSGSNFTAALIVEEWSDYNEDGKKETYSKTSVFISGTKTVSGIRNCEYAFVMLEKKDPLNNLMDVNAYRIFEDKDGIASIYNWRSLKCGMVAEGDNKNTIRNN